MITNGYLVELCHLFQLYYLSFLLSVSTVLYIHIKETDLMNTNGGLVGHPVQFTEVINVSDFIIKENAQGHTSQLSVVTFRKQLWDGVKTSRKFLFQFYKINKCFTSL